MKIICATEYDGVYKDKPFKTALFIATEKGNWPRMYNMNYDAFVRDCKGHDLEHEECTPLYTRFGDKFKITGLKFE